METLTPQEVRDRTAAALALSAGPDAPVASVVERELGGVPSLVVTPEGAGPFHVLVWLHGGGWVIGSAEQSLHSAKDLAAGAGVVVVVPDYRLAPEHPFPAAFDDAVAVIRDVIDRAADLGGPGAKVAVGGDSAGGNLAAAAALVVPGLSYQILAYPVLDATMSHPSYKSAETGYLLTAAAMQWFVDLYLRHGDPTDPRISPHFAPESDLAAACPAHVVIAGYDPLADEGAAYAQRLSDAGVPVTLARYDGQMHGFLTMGAIIPTGAAAMNEAIEHLRTALGSPSGTDDQQVAAGTDPA